MKFIHPTIAIILAAFMAVVNAQVAYSNGTFSCVAGGGSYCAGHSMSTNIIIHCNDKVGQPANCNDNLAGVSPVGVKPFAPCYQSSSTTGDATCSWNCTAYPNSGPSFALPATESPKCNVAAPPTFAVANTTSQITSGCESASVAAVSVNTPFIDLVGIGSSEKFGLPLTTTTTTLDLTLSMLSASYATSFVVLNTSVSTSSSSRNITSQGFNITTLPAVSAMHAQVTGLPPDYVPSTTTSTTTIHPITRVTASYNSSVVVPTGSAGVGNHTVASGTQLGGASTNIRLASGTFALGMIFLVLVLL